MSEFRAAMLACFADEPMVRDQRRTLVLDLVTSAGSVDHVLLAELMPLDGVGDEPPLLGIAGLSVTRVRDANGGHTQLTLRKGVEVLDGICFGRSDLTGTIAEGDVVDVVARLTQPPLRWPRDPPAGDPRRRTRRVISPRCARPRIDGRCTARLDLRGGASGRRDRVAAHREWSGPGPPGDPAAGSRTASEPAVVVDARHPGGWPAPARSRATPVLGHGAIPAPDSGRAGRRPAGRIQAPAATCPPAATGTRARLAGSRHGPVAGSRHRPVAGHRQQRLGRCAWRPGPAAGWSAPPPRRRGAPPLLAPLVALLGLILVAGGSVFAAAKLDLVGGGSADRDRHAASRPTIRARRTTPTRPTPRARRRRRRPSRRRS